MRILLPYLDVRYVVFFFVLYVRDSMTLEFSERPYCVDASLPEGTLVQSSKLVGNDGDEAPLQYGYGGRLEHMQSLQLSLYKHPLKTISLPNISDLVI